MTTVCCSYGNGSIEDKWMFLLLVCASTLMWCYTVLTHRQKEKACSYYQGLIIDRNIQGGKCHAEVSKGTNFQWGTLIDSTEVNYPATLWPTNLSEISARGMTFTCQEGEIIHCFPSSVEASKGFSFFQLNSLVLVIFIVHSGITWNVVFLLDYI